MSKHVFVISHRRSGTHLVIDAIRNNFSRYKNPYIISDYLTSRVPKPMTLDKFRSYLDIAPRVIKSHMHSKIADFFENNLGVLGYIEDMVNSSKIIYVYRDGRDVLTSLYFYRKPLKPKLNNISFSDFIRMDNDFDNNTYDSRLNRIEYWNFHVDSWCKRKTDNILYVAFEQIINDYDATLRKIGEFLDVDMPYEIKNVVRSKPFTYEGVRKVADAFKRAVPDSFRQFYKKCFKRSFGRIQYTSTAFRKGIKGDYKNFFTQKDLDYFDTVSLDVMINLGYYKDMV